MRMLAMGLVALSATVAAQQTRDPKPSAALQFTGTGVISGVVVTADGGRPSRRAIVELRGGTLRVSRTVETGADGQFRFADLPPGEFMIAVSKGGYVETILGQKVPGSGRPGVAIPLLAGQQLTGLSLPLVRGGVITGIVVDEGGEPAFGTPVRAYRWVMKSGERTLQAADMGTTDDRGIYRIPGLLPGDYVVAAIPGNGARISISGDAVSWTARTTGDVSMANTVAALKSEIKSASAYAAGLVPSDSMGFPTLYYPGTMEGSAATSITVAAGTEIAGIDFRLQPVPVGRVSGLVTGPLGPAPRTEVRLVDRTQPPGSVPRTAMTDRDGRFALSQVPAGQYTLVARMAVANAASPFTLELAVGADDRSKEKAKALVRDAEMQHVEAVARGGTQLWAMSDISVDGRDLPEVQLVLQPGTTLSGRVDVEASGGTAAPNLAKLSVSVKGVGQQVGSNWEPGPAVVDAEGRFTIHGVLPGRYRLAVAGVPSGFALRSATFGAQDVLDSLLELTGVETLAGGIVTLTNRVTEVSGVVQSLSTVAAAAATVIVFSADERTWLPESRRIQAVRPSAEGHYLLKNLPPGDYRLVAVDDVEPGRWFDPAYLRSLGGFSTLTLADGGKTTQDVRIR